MKTGFMGCFIFLCHKVITNVQLNGIFFRFYLLQKKQKQFLRNQNAQEMVNFEDNNDFKKEHKCVQFCKRLNEINYKLHLKFI